MTKVNEYSPLNTQQGTTRIQHLLYKKYMKNKNIL